MSVLSRICDLLRPLPLEVVTDCTLPGRRALVQRVLDEFGCPDCVTRSGVTIRVSDDGLLTVHVPHAPTCRSWEATRPNAAQKAATDKIGRTIDTAPCGTRLARRRHVRNGEPRCPICEPRS